MQKIYSIQSAITSESCHTHQGLSHWDVMVSVDELIDQMEKKHPRLFERWCDEGLFDKF